MGTTYVDIEGMSSTLTDMLTNINSYHGFSKNISKVGEDTLHYYNSNSINN